MYVFFEGNAVSLFMQNEKLTAVNLQKAVFVTCRIICT